MSAAFEVIDLARLAAQPWKNGAGVTREIAVHPPGAAHADFDWRVSLAEVAKDAPFSAFPGIDRCIVLMRGAGMRLASVEGGVDARLDRPLQALHVAGELPIAAALIDGPCSDFNVMTRRGAVRCELTVHRAAAELPGGVPTLLWCGDGADWEIAMPAPQRLAPMHGLLWRTGAPALTVAPRGPGAMLEIRLFSEASR